MLQKVYSPFALFTYFFHLVLQVVSEGARNPGIRYSYSLPRVPSRQGEKDHTQPLHSNSAIDKSSKSHNQGKSNTRDQVLDPSEIRKPSNIRISASSVPNRRHIAQTNVRIVSPSRRHRYDDYQKERKLKLDKNITTAEQFVYTHGVQVYGGDNSIRKNVYDGNSDDGNADKDVVLESRRYDSLDGQATRYNRYPEQLEGQSAEARTALLRDERYMWSHGRWTPCSNKCGDGLYYILLYLT